MSGERAMDGGMAGGWDEDGIEALLVEAAETLWSVPDTDGPMGYRSCMPAVIRDFWEAYGADKLPAGHRPRSVAVSRERLKRLDMVEQWLKRLPPRFYRIVWMRAFHDAKLVKMGWRVIGKANRMSHETARYTYDDAISMLVGIANGGVCGAETPLFA